MNHTIDLILSVSLFRFSFSIILSPVLLFCAEKEMDLFCIIEVLLHRVEEAAAINFGSQHNRVKKEKEKERQSALYTMKVENTKQCQLC